MEVIWSLFSCEIPLLKLYHFLENMALNVSCLHILTFPCCLKFYTVWHVEPPMRDVEIIIKELSFLSSPHSFESMANNAFHFDRVQMNIKVGQDWSLLACLGNCLMNMPWGDVSTTQKQSFKINTEVICLFLNERHHMGQSLLVTVRTLMEL